MGPMGLLFKKISFHLYFVTSKTCTSGSVHYNHTIIMRSCVTYNEQTEDLLFV